MHELTDILYETSVFGDEIAVFAKVRSNRSAILIGTTGRQG